MSNREILRKEVIPGKWMTLVKGDLTKEAVDAIVNAANSYLKHGGGVAGAIVRSGGDIIQEESDRIGFVPVGEAVLTSGGKLVAGHVIHTVGPHWGEGNEDQKLYQAIRNSLQLAAREGFVRVSLPAISTGIFGFPKDRCARIMFAAIHRFLQKYPENSLKEIRICLLDDATMQIFLQVSEQIKIFDHILGKDIQDNKGRHRQ